MSSLRAVVRAERERTNILFGFAFFMVAFLYHESSRRRDYVDVELQDLQGAVRTSNAKAEGAAEAAKAQREKSESRWTRGNVITAALIGVVTIALAITGYSIVS